MDIKGLLQAGFNAIEQKATQIKNSAGQFVARKQPVIIGWLDGKSDALGTGPQKLHDLAFGCQEDVRDKNLANMAHTIKYCRKVYSSLPYNKGNCRIILGWGKRIWPSSAGLAKPFVLPKPAPFSFYQQQTGFPAIERLLAGFKLPALIF